MCTMTPHWREEEGGSGGGREWGREEVGEGGSGEGREWGREGMGEGRREGVGEGGNGGGKRRRKV